MKTYKSYDEFKTFDRNLRKQGKEISDTYLSHVKSALNFFHTEGAHNIQILNDVLDTATAMRLQRNRIVDWVAQLAGHAVIKLDGGLFGFGKKLADVEYSDILDGVAVFFEQYPDWYSWKKEQEPEEYNALSAMQKLIKKLEKEAKTASEHHYSMVAGMIESFKEQLKVTPIAPDEVVEEEKEEEKDEVVAVAA